MTTGSASSNTRLPLILLLLALLIGLLLFAFSSLNVRTNTATQGNENQCQNGGLSFDEQQEAYILAQTVEQYCTTNPSPANYGIGLYTICYKDGSGERFQSPIFPGFKNNIYPGNPSNYTHSEQSVYGWLQNKFSSVSIDQVQVMAIYTVIFSQVSVCVLCQKDMKMWQRVLRARVKIMQVYLSVWDIIYGKGFDPATYPAGTGIPITVDMLRKVPITFVP